MHTLLTTFGIPILLIGIGYIASRVKGDKP